MTDKKEKSIVPASMIEKAVNRVVKQGIDESKVKAQKFRFENWSSTTKGFQVTMSADAFYDDTDQTLELGRITVGG